MMQDNKWMRRAGIAVLTVMVVGFWGLTLEAIRGGRIWIGAGYRGVPIDTYGQLILLVFFTVFGAILAVRYWR